MSEANATITPETTVTVDTSAPKPAPEKPSAKDDEKPAWLDGRLARERQSVLKELGIESLEDAKKIFAAAKADEDAKKSEAEKRIEAENALKNAKAEKEAMAQALNAYAQSQMNALTEAQRQAVAAVAGEDPSKQLKTIEALRPTWTSAASTQTAAPKDTAPAPNAPKDAGSVSAPLDHKSVYEELSKTNPIVAARYALEYGVFSK